METDTHNPMDKHNEESMVTYTLVFIALLVLLTATYLAYLVDLGTWGFFELNLLLALFIATLKAALVLLVFMHVRLSPKLVWVFSMCSFLWLILMIAGFENDYIGRRWDAPQSHNFMSPEASSMEHLQ